MTLRYSTAAKTGHRGAGLGNECFAWAKSYLAADALDIKLLAPQWLWHRYDIPRHLGIGRVDMMRATMLGHGPGAHHVTEHDYRSTGEIDYGAAIKALAERGDFCGLRTLVHSGMWGGYAAVARARPFLLSKLLGVAGGIAAVQEGQGRSGKVRVGVHVRAGDFSDVPPRAGEFNRAVPMSWYADAMAALDQALDGACDFLVCSDGNPVQLVAAKARSQVRIFRGNGHTAAIQELLALASCDVLICSVSSFSMLAAFLSGAPYVWYRPQLVDHDGWLSLWGHEPAQQHPSSLTRRAIQAAHSSLGLSRGVPWEARDLFPPEWLAHLAGTAELRDPTRDLLSYGVVASGRRPHS